MPGGGAGLGFQVAGSASAEELLTESLSELRWPRVSLPCKGAKRLPMNFRISASRALQTTATPPAGWPAIGMHADVLGQAHTTSMCVHVVARWGMGLWEFTFRALGRRHREIGARILGIGNGGGQLRSEFTERCLSKCARRGAAKTLAARLWEGGKTAFCISQAAASRTRGNKGLGLPNPTFRRFWAYRLADWGSSGRPRWT